MKKTLISLNLSQKLVFFFSAILIIVSIVTLAQFINSTQNIKSARLGNVETYTIQLNKAIAAQFYERYGDVQAFAQNEVFLGKNKKLMIETLNNYANLYGIYNLILFIDTEGRLIAINDKSPQKSQLDVSELYNINFKNEPWFGHALTEQYTKDMSKGYDGSVFVPLINDDLTKAAYKKNVNSSLFAAPVKDHNGHIIGIICNRANSTWFENEILNLKEQLQQQNWISGSIQVLGPNGEFAMASIGQEKDLLDLPEDTITSKIQIKESKFIDDLNWYSQIKVPKSVLYSDVIASEKRFYITLISILLIAVSLSYIIAQKISRDLSRISEKIAQMADYTAQMTNEFSKSSQGLSQNSVSQVSSIQQSVAALAQMTSMISQTSDKVKVSNDLSQNVESKALTGRDIMEKVIHSMDEIRSTNLELQEINKTMNQISHKTELINDIVFKTQLLSFNASIEAARAGQNGRGFSVVADEVSHLAELSGKASKEIENLLNESKRKVEASLINIQSKITDGTQVTLEANQTFNDITLNIQSISQQLKSVNEAAQQQSIGINQANSAMKELESSADANSQTATEFNKRFDELKNKAENLNQTTVDLKRIVNG